MCLNENFDYHDSRWTFVLLGDLNTYNLKIKRFSFPFVILPARI
jgi:hypothetical protein